MVLFPVSGLFGMGQVWIRGGSGVESAATLLISVYEPEPPLLYQSTFQMWLRLLPRAAHDPAALFGPVERQALGQISGIDGRRQCTIKDGCDHPGGKEGQVQHHADIALAAPIAPGKGLDAVDAPRTQLSQPGLGADDGPDQA